MDYKMKLTDEQKAILGGSRGDTMAKVMETLVRYGELFGADEMVPVTRNTITLSHRSDSRRSLPSMR